jgi:hypothetical protein
MHPIWNRAEVSESGNFLQGSAEEASKVLPYGVSYTTILIAISIGLSYLGTIHVDDNLAEADSQRRCAAK